MTDEEYWDYKAQIKLIEKANTASQDAMRELSNLMSKVMTLKTCGLCGGTDAVLWVATTCPDEHVMTTRMCAQCTTRNCLDRCITCQQPTLDYAVKHDENNTWMHSWAEE